ncbi:MAG: TetR family transcriptional regulator [Alphaproteobacteria bacterium]|nr:TetR family transcriptional regulator [Alphaproteobacteria bacterium]
MARRTKEEAEQTRIEILRSALDIFCEKGYSRTTFDEIAKRINLTKGAVYWHFRNKPDLIAALIREAFNRANNIILQKVPEIKSVDDLKQRCIINATLVRDEPYYRKFLFFIFYQMEWSEAILGTICKSIKDIDEYPLKEIKQTLTFSQKNGEISPEINIEATAQILCSLWHGLLGGFITGKCTLDFPTLVEKSFDLITNGLKRKVL